MKMEYRATPPTLGSGTNNTSPQCDSSGNLKTTLAAGSEFATQVDDTAITPGVSVGIKIGAMADETAPDSVDEGDFGLLRMTLSRLLKTSMGDLFSGENQNLAVLGVAFKPSASNAFTGTTTQNNSFTTVNIKSSAGNVLQFDVTNTTASTKYFQLHNTSTTPAGAATATRKWTIPASATVSIGPGEIGHNGIYGASGWAIANSTTLTTYTAGVAGDLVCDITFI